MQDQSKEWSGTKDDVEQANKVQRLTTRELQLVMFYRKMRKRDQLNLIRIAEAFSSET